MAIPDNAPEPATSSSAQRRRQMSQSLPPAREAFLALTEFMDAQRIAHRHLRFLHDHEDEIADPKRVATERLSVKWPTLDWEQVEQVRAHVLAARTDSDDPEGVSALNDAVEKIRQLAPGHDPLLVVLDVLQASTQRAPLSGKIYASQLALAVADFEHHIHSLLRILANFEPSGFIATDCKFTWGEIESAGSVEALRAKKINNTVSQIMHGGLDDWLAAFRDRTGAHLPRILKENKRRHEITEVLLRRNLVTHAGGYVSTRYIDGLRRAGAPTDRRPGERLDVDFAYVSRALDSFMEAGFALAVNIIMKVAGDERDRFEERLVNMLYEFLPEGRAEACRRLCDEYAEHPFSRPSLQAVVKVNLWLSKRDLGWHASVREEAAEWDTSDLPSRFGLARLLLIESYEDAETVAQQLLDDGEIKPHEWNTWPLAKPLRERGVVTSTTST